MNFSPSSALRVTPAPRRRLVAMGLAVAPMVWGLIGCSPRGPLRIGFLGGLSGRMADLGVAGRNGALLAVEHLNATGGVGGRLLELVPLDDEQNPEVALRRLKEFTNAGVPLVIGPMTSVMASALVGPATQGGIALISPTASARELSGKADALFCLAPQAPESGAQHAAFLHAQGLRAVALVKDFQNKAYAQDWAQGLAQRLTELGGRITLDTHFVSAPGLAYGDIAQQLVAARADAIVLVTNVSDTAVLSQQIRQRDDKVQLSATPWAAHDQLLPMGGRAIEGMTVAQLIDRSNQSADYLKFVTQFRERFSEAPGYRSVKAYDATLLGVEALRRQQRGQPLVEALRALRAFPGLQAPLALDEFGDSRSPVYMTRVQGGQFVPVKSV